MEKALTLKALSNKSPKATHHCELNIFFLEQISDPVKNRPHGCKEKRTKFLVGIQSSLHSSARMKEGEGGKVLVAYNQI